ncbi:F0F1 ATP synthase subunit delta [Leeia sp. TBRC 13508]|uniref:ATP synthase subunit delta n=1 Tax=Leeia speluncae TaxID=2884804 RepID=A0ABS8D337_9NEIS|nr:F0F1 ATP synthase subunit delta [Leeia speluncae]MCB6182585.1 F0F1 ATP synthase subunit delta [Leeia speluncae]
MAEIVTVARPYAEAAFKLSNELGQLAAWDDALRLLVAVVQNEQVADVIGNPNISGSQVESLLLDIVSDKVSSEVKNFVRVLVENKRLVLLPEISRQFAELKLKAENSIDASIVSAFPLTDAQLGELTAQLVKRFDRQIRAQVTVDPELLGGVKITVGDVVVDASVRGKLQAMAYGLKS